MHGGSAGAQYTRAHKTGKRFMVTKGCVSFAGNEKFKEAYGILFQLAAVCGLKA
jgi:hypothetical protein